MDTPARQQQSEGECPHCGNDSGDCLSMRCLKCEALLCSRMVTPVLATHPTTRTSIAFTGIPAAPLYLFTSIAKVEFQ